MERRSAREIPPSAWKAAPVGMTQRRAKRSYGPRSGWCNVRS